MRSVCALLFPHLRTFSLFRFSPRSVRLEIKDYVDIILSGSYVYGYFSVTVSGHYVPVRIVSSMVISISAALLARFQTTTGPAKSIGYQVLLGASIRMGMQQLLICAQKVHIETMSQRRRYFCCRCKASVAPSSSLS